MESQAMQLQSAESYITKSASKWLDDVFNDLNEYVKYEIQILTYIYIYWLTKLLFLFVKNVVNRITEKYLYRVDVFSCFVNCIKTEYELLLLLKY
jgi:hypothetical protein